MQGTTEEVGELEEAVERVGGTEFPYISMEDHPPGEGTLGLGLRLEPPLEDNRTDWKVEPFLDQGRTIRFDGVGSDEYLQRGLYE